MSHLAIKEGDDFSLEGEVNSIKHWECQVGEVCDHKLYDEELAGQRGSYSQTHTQDLGSTVKFITSKGKGGLFLGGLPHPHL